MPGWLSDYVAATPESEARVTRGVRIGKPAALFSPWYYN